MFKKLVYLSLFVTMGVNAQTCKGYIDNEWSNGRYTVATTNGGTTVTDAETNLMWKQCAEGLAGASCDQGNALSASWINALAVPEGVDYAGHQDWRLPNINELMSIVAYNCSFPAINETVFPGTASNNFWTSTPRASIANQIRQVYFYDGTETATGQAVMNHVRLVRTN